MSFVATAIVGAAVVTREIRKSKKAAKALASMASRDAQAQTAAIEAQTKAMRQKAVTPPPPPPPAPVAAPIRQASPGTGSTVISPAMLAGASTRRRKKGNRSGSSGLGYGSRL